MIRTIKTTFVFAALAGFSYSLSAFPEYLKIYASDPGSRKDMRQQCATCHVNPAGGGSLNDFGKAFAAGGHRITDALRAKFPDRFEFPESSQAGNLPVTFVANSDSQAIIEMNGKRYLLDTKTRTVREVPVTAPVAGQAQAPKSDSSSAGAPTGDNVYQQGDVRLISLPTAKPIAKGAVISEFTHRFPFEDYDVTDGSGLFGLDGFATPSFGFAYGITDRIHVGASRSPSSLGRPILVYAGINLLDENRKHPFTATARIGLEGRDHFQRNFTTSLELTLARSITRHAQVYLVPTISFNNRRFGPTTRNLAGANTFAIGAGGALNIRPTIALMAEANWRVNEAGKFGSTSPAIGFGIQKETVSRRHAFSLIFTNSVGTTFAQRSGTQESLLGPGSNNSLAIGFNLSRRIF